MLGFNALSEAALGDPSFAAAPAAPSNAAQIAVGTANFSFSGASAYTDPANTAVNFTWYVTASGPQTATASGFLVTQFGTALAKQSTTAVVSGFTGTHIGAPTGFIVQVASGFKPTAFGTGRVNLTLPATGFASGVRGTPVLNITQPATSIAPATAFGRPRGAALQRASVSGFITGSFGVPSLVTARTALAAGFITGKFGRPSVPTARTQTASGFLATTFGTPAYPPPQYGLADGFIATQFGNPSQVVSQIGITTGFASVAFGTPHLPEAKTGFADPTHTTAFGTPSAAIEGVGAGYYKVQPYAPSTAFGTPVVPYVATGFSATQFGTPLYMLRASGFSGTAFGTPASRNANVQFAAAPATAFGTPSTPTNRAQSASGFAVTLFGYAAAYEFDPVSLAQTLHASGVRSTRLGTPSAARAVIATASGFRAPSFGTPVYHAPQDVAVSGWAMTAFGAPTASAGPHSYSLRAAGAKGTSFGLAVVGVTVNPFGSARTRFGTPGAALAGARHAYPIPARTGFGVPRSRIDFSYPVQATDPSTNVGTPVAIVSHKARMSAPRVQFGTPIIERNPTC